jgi:hypothetical protein
MNTTQRMFPLELNNALTSPANYCLKIENQPADTTNPVPSVDPNILIVSGAGRASFDPLPAANDAAGSPARVRLDVEVPAIGSASRSVFVTSSHPDTRITVNAYTGTCADGGSLVSSVQLGNGELFDPLFCQRDPVPASCTLSVTSNETHNISLVAPGLQAPGLQAPGLQAPVLQAPVLQAPGLQAPVLQAPVLQAPGLQAPSFQADSAEAPVLQAPSFQAPGFQAESLVSPSLQAPSLQAPSLQAAVEGDAIYYQDLTYILETGGNVTTTYSADIALIGLDPATSGVELIAWQPNVHTTTVADPVNNNCVALPQADNDVIAAVNMGSPGLQAPGLQAPSLGDVSLPFAFPDLGQEPYNGDITFNGKPGDLINLTVRLWVTDVVVDPDTGEVTIDPDGVVTAQDQLERLYRCSTGNELPDDDCLPQEIKNGAFLLVPFGAAAHGCSGVDVQNPQNGVDCISSNEEKIEPPDLFAPVFDPPDGGTVAHEAELDESGNCCAVSTPGTVPVGINVEDQSSVTVTCSSGGVPLDEVTTTFSFGDTFVDCTAIDEALNEANATITISIVDTVDPVINMPADITDAEATGPAGVFVNYEVTADDVTATDIVCTRPDGLGGTEAVAYNGDNYFVGTTTVSCTATDQGGRTASGSFQITVLDVGLPTISVEITTLDYPPAEATSAAGASVTFDVTALDDIDDDVASECKITGTNTIVESGDTFSYVPPGPTSTSVTCTAMDDAVPPNTASATFDVIVDDTTPPDIDMTGDITGIVIGATVNYEDHGFTVTDDVDPDPVVNCDTASGSVFDSLGTTLVSCTATDSSNNTSAATTFNVTVDQVKPGGITAKNSVKAGSTDPVRWTWEDDAQPANTIFVGDPATTHMIEAFAGPTCSGTNVIVEDPGSSFWQLLEGNVYGYNWQTPDNASGKHCIRVTLKATGQSQETESTIR